MLHRILIEEAGVDDIAHDIIQRCVFGLPLDEPTIAAGRYLWLGACEVQAAFVKRLRPDDLVRVSQGPAPR